MVTSAVMILVHGKALSWTDSKRMMANGEAFLDSLLCVSPESISAQQVRRSARSGFVPEEIEGLICFGQLEELVPYIQSEFFTPEIIAPVCQCAAKFCSWVLGMVEAYKYSAGQAHNRLSLLNKSQFASLHAAAPRETAVFEYPAPISTTASAPRKKRQLPTASPVHPAPSTPLDGNTAYKQALRPMDNIGPPSDVNVPMSRDELLGRRIAQKRQMERLAGKSAGVVVLEEGRQTFTCADGTQVPFEVVGKLELKVCQLTTTCCYGSQQLPLSVSWRTGHPSQLRRVPRSLRHV
jgi:hypothetical protein